MPSWKVDRTASAILDFAMVGFATFTCSMAVEPRFQVVHVVGTEGRIELSEVPFNAPNDRSLASIRVQVKASGEVERIEVETCDQYTIQGDLFSRAILDDYSGADLDRGRDPEYGRHRGDPGLGPIAKLGHA